MSLTDASQAEQISRPASSPRGRAGRPPDSEREPLRVAQIYALHASHSYPTGDATLVVQIGDPTCEPQRHGLRASRSTWVEIFAALASADPILLERVRAKL